MFVKCWTKKGTEWLRHWNSRSIYFQHKLRKTPLAMTNLQNVHDMLRRNAWGFAKMSRQINNRTSSVSPWFYEIPYYCSSRLLTNLSTNFVQNERLKFEFLHEKISLTLSQTQIAFSNIHVVMFCRCLARCVWSVRTTWSWVWNVCLKPLRPHFVNLENIDNKHTEPQSSELNFSQSFLHLFFSEAIRRLSVPLF